MANYKNKYLNDVLKAGQMLYDAKDALPGQEAALRKEYTGDRLLKEINALKSNISQLEKNLSDVHASGRDKMLAAAQAQRENKQKEYSPWANKVSVDFDILRLPYVTLTQAQLQNLVARNRYDTLFIGALQNYIADKGINYPVDFATPCDKLERAIHDTANYFLSWLSQSKGGYSVLVSNPHNLDELDKNLT